MIGRFGPGTRPLLPAPFHIFIRAVATEGDAGKSVRVAQVGHEQVAVAIGQAEIGDHEIDATRGGDFARAHRGRDASDTVAATLQ